MSPGSFDNGAELVDATGGQERRFADAFRLLHEAVRQKAFPGAALAVTVGDELLAWRGFGSFTYEADSPEVKRETVWDLASLTKPIATTSMAMLLFEQGKLKLDARVADLLPEFTAGARDWLPDGSADRDAPSQTAARVARRSDGAYVAGALLRPAGAPEAVSGRRWAGGDVGGGARGPAGSQAGDAEQV